MDRSTLFRYLSSALLGALLAPLTSYAIAIEPGSPVPGTSLSIRKGPGADDDVSVTAAPLPTRGTLVSLHANELLVLSDSEPAPDAFSRLLRDRVTGEVIDVPPRLLALLRDLTNAETPVRIEFISGYRSWKLNEMLRKKGHNVSPNSQHCAGHAMDFRFEGMTSKQLAQAVEGLRWRGGLAYYPGDTDRFVHADVGPNRRWRGR